MFGCALENFSRAQNFVQQIAHVVYEDVVLPDLLHHLEKARCLGQIHLDQLVTESSKSPKQAIKLDKTRRAFLLG